MTMDKLGLTEAVSLRKKAYWARRQGYGETADIFLRRAGILERTEEARSDTLGGVVNYIMNGRKDGKEKQGS